MRMLFASLLAASLATLPSLHARAQGHPVAGEMYGAPRPFVERRLREAVPAHDVANWPLVGPGVAALLASYPLSWVVTVVWRIGTSNCVAEPASLADPSGTRCPTGPHLDALGQMGIPLVGPWLALPSFTGTDVFLPVISGIMQPLALGLLIAGIATPRHVPAQPATLQLRMGVSSMQLDVHF